MNILFRVDSSSTIGLGHLMRCLVLAQQYQQQHVIFATQNLSGSAHQKIKKNNYPIITLTSNTDKELNSIIIKNNIDMVVFDHYEIDYNYEKYIKEKTGVKILSFDDTYQKHYCDILLNHNIYAKKEQYKDLVPDNCEIRCGKKYTLIRDEFKKIISKKRQINKKKPTAFVAMGGVDYSNISLLVLKVLMRFDDIIINLATTSANRNISKLQNFAQKHSPLNIHIDNENIAYLMDNSDFAVVTPSVIVYEVMILNLPFIAIKTAKNQKLFYKYLKQNKYHVLHEFNIDILSSHIQAILR